MLNSQTVPTPRSLRRTVAAWFNKENLLPRSTMGGKDSKNISTVDVYPADGPAPKNQPLPLKKLMVAPVLIAGLNYACLALVDP